MGRIDTPPPGAEARDTAAIRSFIESAHREGLISDELRTTLVNRLEATTGPAPSTPAPAGPSSAPAPSRPASSSTRPTAHPHPALAEVRATAYRVGRSLEARIETWPGRPPPALQAACAALDDARRSGSVDELTFAIAAARRTLQRYQPPRPAAEPVAAAPVPAPPPPAPAAAPSTPARGAPPPPIVPPARARRKAAIWARFTRIRLKRTWGTFTADFAANALTYLGVLLAVVVIYAFFAFGYFGEVLADDNRQWREFAFLGVVGFFLGAAWLLRTRSSIPQTAVAVEVIGVVMIPIMMAATIRDWCGPDYRWWCVPDYDGPPRWLAYGAVGLLAVGVYVWFASRRRLYAYFVAPMLWITVGALGLYLEDGLGLIREGTRPSWDAFTADGISGPQLISVLLAIALTLAAAQRFRTTVPGRLLAVPTMRAGLLCAPLVLVVSVVFAHNDAVAGGIARPGVADLAWPTTVATAVAAVVFALGAKATFAWESFSDRMQRDITLVLRISSYLSLGASWVFATGLGVTPGWLGVGFVAYAAAIAAIDQSLGGTDVASLSIARAAGAVGATMALIEPVPALVAWGSLSMLAVARSQSRAIRVRTARYVPIPRDEEDRIAELWLPMLVAVGAGAARIGFPGSTPWVLAGIALMLAGTRFLPEATRQLRSFAALPAILVGVGSLGVEIARRATGGGMPDVSFGLFLLVLAGVAAAVAVAASSRVVAATALGTAGALILTRSFVDAQPLPTAWADTSVLAVVGIGLIGTMILRSHPVLVIGALGHFAVLLAVARSFWFEDTALFGLGVLAAAHIAEIAGTEIGRAGTFRTWADRYPGRRTAIEAIPAAVTALALPPIAILAGRRVPWIRSERARFGPVLSGMSWLYAAGSMQRRVPMQRGFRSLAYVGAFTAIAVAIPSTTAALTTAWSAAAVTALLAVTARRPGASTVSWIYGVAALALTAGRLGVADRDLHFVLHATAVALIIGPAIALMRRGRTTGVRDPWLRPPVAIGLAGLPATVALSIADPRGLAVVALSGAAAYALLGWATRTGGLSLPSLTMVAVAYAWILYDTGIAHPFDQPLWWMPLAGTAIAISGLLPGRRSWRLLRDPAPGALVTGLGLATLTIVLAVSAGIADLAFLATAALLSLVWGIRRTDPWLGAAAVALVTAGLLAGGFWAAAATATTGLITASVSDQRRDHSLGPPLQWLAIGWFVATFWELDAWLHWTHGELTAAAAVTAGTLISAATGLALAIRLPARARRWAIPLQGLGQLAALTTLAVAATWLDPSAAFGVAAGVGLGEAVATGLFGTVRRITGLVVASTALGGAAFAAATRWLEWSDTTVMSATGTAAGIVLAAAAALYLTDRLPERIRVWRAPLLVVSQVGMLATVVVAAATPSTRTADGAIALMALLDAAAAGTVGSARQIRPLVQVASGFIAVGGYFGLSWMDAGPAPTIAALTGTGALLVTAWLVLGLIPQPPQRMVLWRDGFLAVSQIAAIGAAAVAWTELEAGTAAGITAGIVAFESIVCGIFASVKRNPFAAAAAAVGTGVAYGLSGRWLEWDAATFAQITGILAVTLLGAWTATAVRPSLPERIRLWRPTLLAGSQLAAVVTVIAAQVGLTPAAAAGAITLLAAADAFVAGLIGTIRRDRALVAVATALAATAYGYGAVWLDAAVTGFVAATGTVGAALLGCWFIGSIRSALPDRVELWLSSLLFAGQLAALTTVVAAGVGFAIGDTWGVLSIVAAYESVLTGALGTLRRRQDEIAVSVGLAGVAAGSAAAWTGAGTAALTAVTGIEAALVGAAATVLARISDEPDARVRLWVFPLHGLALVAAGATAALGALLGNGHPLWVGATVCAATGLYLGMNAWSLPRGAGLREIAGLAFSGAAAFSTAWQVEWGSSASFVVFGVGALAVPAAGWAGAVSSSDHPWTRSGVIMGAGFSIVALIAAAAHYGVQGGEFAGAVLLTGGALAAHGILARSFVEVEGAVVTWLAALLLILNAELSLSVHAAVVITSVGLLSVIEIERFRHRVEQLESPPRLHHAEWAMMLAPPALAAMEMLDIDRLWLGLLLFGEGAALLSWGAITQVRRRALLGVAVMTLSIVLGIAVPAVEGVRGGLTGGTWLVIGALAAVIFIVAGSMIERYRTRIGRRLARFGEILEHWE